MYQSHDHKIINFYKQAIPKGTSLSKLRRSELFVGIMIHNVLSSVGATCSKSYNSGIYYRTCRLILCIDYSERSGEIDRAVIFPDSFSRRLLSFSSLQPPGRFKSTIVITTFIISPSGTKKYNDFLFLNFIFEK